MGPRRLRLLMALGAALLLARVAEAQDDAAVTEARRLYSEATKALEEERFREAALGFEAAHRLTPHAVALYTAAQAWQIAGEPARAADAYTLALETPALDDQQAERARRRLEQLSKNVGWVAVAGEERARVRLDDHMEVEAPARLHALPGAHTVTMVAADGTTTTVEVSIEAGRATRLVTDDALAAARHPSPTEPEPTTEPTPAPSTTAAPDRASTRAPLLTTVGWATAGGGVALLIGGAVSGMSAKDAESTFEAAPTRATLEHAKDLQRRTNILLGIGAGLTAAGAGLVVWQTFFRTEDGPASTPSVTRRGLSVGVVPTGVVAAGRF